MERDPVCNPELRPGQEVADANDGGHTYHFCSTECRDRFLKAPDQFLETATQARAKR